MNSSRDRKILQAIPDMFMVLDRLGTVVDFKPSASFDPAMPAEEFMGRRLSEVMPAQISEPAMERVAAVLDGGGTRLLEYSLGEGDTVNEFECRFSLLDRGEVLCIIRDITDRKAAARDLAGSRQRLRALMDASPYMSILLDPLGTILAINDLASGMYNRMAEEMVGTSYWEYLQPQVAELRKRRLQGVVRDGQPVQVTEVDGDRSYEISIHPVTGADGRVESAAVFVRDISERTRAEERLLESEARYRRLFDENPIPMYIYDMDYLKILAVNQALLRSYGYSRAELLGMTMVDIRPPEDAEKIRDNVRYLRGHHLYQGRWRHIKKDGGVLDVDITSTDFPFEGRVARLVVCQDVTERLRVEEALQESEDRFRTAFMTGPDAIAIINAETGVYEDVNDAFLGITGLSRREVVGRTSEEFRIWRDQKERDRFYDVLRREGRVEHFESDFICRDGKVIKGLLSANIIFLAEKPHLLLAARDITSLKAAQRALAESEEKFRTAFRTSPDSVNLNRLEDGLYVDINEGFSRITGYRWEDVAGQTSADIDIWVDHEDRRRLVEGLQKTGEVSNLEARFRMKDGTIVDGLMSARILNIDGVPHILSITRDVTEWSAAKRQIQASLTEKEVLLKEVHHRVKNNLQVISGLLNLQAHHITDEAGREIYRESQNRIITMSLIHEELYQARDLAHVDFASYIEGLTGNLFGSYAARSGHVTLDLATESVDLVVDTAIPCGLIINELVSNALKHAFPDGREGRISVRFSRMEDGRYQLVVEDDGVGLPDVSDIRKHRSLGMQLVTVLAEQLGADLVISPGPGATFTLTFSEYREAGTDLI